MKKSTLAIFIILSGCLVLLSGIWIFFQRSLDELELSSNGNTETYKKHYVLIADQENQMLWQAVYESAKAQAAQDDAYLELMEADNEAGYDQADCLVISIACQVDGIILKPDGSARVRELIDEAAESDIPVVTVLEDDSSSRRISFVGVNSYQMGDTYAKQVMELLNPGTTEIMVLMDNQTNDSGRSLIYSIMVQSIEKRKAAEQTVNITAYSVDSSADFDAEEAVRDIFVNLESLPDILVCMDEVVSECAYQAMVDYNEVGNIDIIGYYYSSALLEAVQRGTVPVTIALDAEEIGQYSINALEEYKALGHVNSYYNVGMNIISRDNAASFLEPEQEQEG